MEKAILGLRQTNDADPRYFCWCAKPPLGEGQHEKRCYDARTALSAAAPGSGQAWSQEPLTLAVIEAALAKFTREELTVIAEK